MKRDQGKEDGLEGGNQGGYEGQRDHPSGMEARAQWVRAGLKAPEDSSETPGSPCGGANKRTKERVHLFHCHSYKRTLQTTPCDSHGITALQQLANPIPVYTTHYSPVPLQPSCCLQQASCPTIPTPRRTTAPSHSTATTRLSGNSGMEGCSTALHQHKTDHLNNTVLQPSMPELPLNLVRWLPRTTNTAFELGECEGLPDRMMDHDS